MYQGPAYYVADDQGLATPVRSYADDAAGDDVEWMLTHLSTSPSRGLCTFTYLGVSYSITAFSMSLTVMSVSASYMVDI